MADESGYDEEHTLLYEVQMAHTDRGDVAFYREVAGDADGPVLELGCGTGRISLELLADGVDVDGLDASPAALSVLRERAAERGLDPSVREGDMTDFGTDRAYDLVICPFNTIQHARTVDEQAATLRSVHGALAPGGRFVFDTFVPHFEVICERYGEWDESEITHEGTDYRLRTRTALDDEVQQTIHVRNELCQAGDVVATGDHWTTILPHQQVELLARSSPFEDWEVTGDFEDRPLADGDSVQTWTLRKAVR